MATVTTPAGDVLEGVTGSLLDYYRGEGYTITDDEPEAQFPVTFDSRDVPAKSAPKADWVEYAEEQGVPDAESKTKAELLDELGS